MLRKSIWAVFFICAAIQVAMPEEAQFRVLEDTPAWIHVNFPPPLTYANADIMIPRGSIVTNVSSPSPHFEINGRPIVGHTEIFFEGRKYIIAANTFVPMDTEEIFHESFLTSADPEASIWITSYFLEALHFGDRDVLMPHEQRIVDTFEGAQHGVWLDISGFRQSLVITQSAISIGGLHQDQFWIRRIERIPNGYRVTVTWNTTNPFWYYRPVFRSMRVSLPDRDTTPVFDFYFIVDGDYLDVYYSTDPTSSERFFSATFALFDSEMIRYLIEIFFQGSRQLGPSGITFWPRRADGSMDFPHHPLTVPENTTAVFVFEDTVVRAPLFEIPAAATEPEVHIADISEEQPSPVMATILEAQPTSVSDTRNHENGMPPWVLLALIGGAVVVIGGVVLLFVRRKK